MTKRIKNEISIGSKLQPVVEDVNTEYAGRSETMKELLNYFIEISYHLPAIYNVVMNNFDYAPGIIFQSHRTEKFFFRINNTVDVKNGVSFTVNRLDTCRHDNEYIFIPDINKNSHSLRMVIKYLKTIMKNPTVAMYLSEKYPYNCELLLDDKYFTEKGIKTATEYCNRYYYFKRIRQQFYNRINNSVSANFYKIAKQYNDDIYEMAYTFKGGICNPIITIKTRARLFYGDYTKYEQFKKEICSVFYDDYNKIINDIEACKKENPDDFQDTWKFYNKPMIIIDGFDDELGRFCRVFCLSSNYKYIINPTIKIDYKDIVFPKRN